MAKKEKRLKWISLVFLTVAGGLMSFAVPFRYGELTRDASWLSIFLASLGILIFMKVSSLSKKGGRRFFAGWWGSFVYFLITFYWIPNALSIYGEISFWIALAALGLLAGYLALFLGAWAYIAGLEVIRERTGGAHAFLWASSWAGLEAIREYLFTGMTWGELSHGFAFSPFFARTSAIWGTHGITFLWILFLSLILLKGVDRRFWAYLGSTLGVFVLAGIVISSLKPNDEELKAYKIALVQPNISQAIKWNPNKANEHFELLLSMTNEAMKQEPDLIIWPETAYPYLVSQSQTQFPIKTTVPVIVGGVVRDRRVNKNSALLLEGDQIKAQFSKIHLVPFGEYVPFQEWIPFGKLVANAGNFVPGSKSQAPLQPTGTSLRLGPLICYEDIFSRHAVDLARKDVNLLVNMTNDAWYDMSSALAQHTDISAFQSYQTGLPLVRATNNGITSYITPYERKDVPAFRRGLFIEEIKVQSQPSRTFFAWTHPLMQWIWWALFFACLFWSNRRKKRIFFKA